MPHVLLVCRACKMNNGDLADYSWFHLEICLIDSKRLLYGPYTMGGNISVGWFVHRTFILILPSFNEGLV